MPKPKAGIVDMSGRNVIVTGASPGSLGFETARILAAWGASVAVSSLRNAETMESALRTALRESGADEGNISAHPLNLSDPASVGCFADWHRRRYGGKLHVLINNAGIHKNIINPRTRPACGPDGFEPHWRANYLGTFHLTHTLLPILQQTGLESGDARIINLSSHVHDRGRNRNLFHPPARYHSWEAYGLSKLALMHFTRELQRKFAEEYNLQAVAVHPGSVKTNLTLGAALPGGAGKMLRGIYSALASLIMLSAAAGAQTTVMCASAGRPRGGRYFNHCAQREPSTECDDPAVSKRLWEETEAWVKSLPESEPDHESA